MQFLGAPHRTNHEQHTKSLEQQGLPADRQQNQRKATGYNRPNPAASLTDQVVDAGMLMHVQKAKHQIPCEKHMEKCLRHKGV